MEVSNPDRLVFPGHTKAEVVEHYRRVAPRMFELMGDRPLTLQRFPKGIGEQGFMQKNASAHFPDTIRRYEVPKQGDGVTVYPVLDRAEDVVYLANQGTLTFHMWTSTTHAPWHPDWLVMDLDRSEADVEGVRFATARMGELLGEFGLTGFPLATGSSGFHVWVRLDGSEPTDRVSVATRALAGIAAARHPDRLTTEFLKRERRGRVFVDWLRNGPTATVVVPFSLRPRPPAPVAVPLTWDELDRALPDGWRIGAIDDRLALSLDPSARRLPVDAILAAATEADVDFETEFDRFGRR